MDIIDLSGVRVPRLGNRVAGVRLAYQPRARAWHWESLDGRPPDRSRLKSRARDAGNGTLEIWINDDIFPDAGLFWGGYGVDTLLDDLDTMPDRQKIVVHINSPGGDVFEGVAIYNLLVSDPADVETVVDGEAMSIASVVTQAGDNRSVSEAGIVMIHNPWTLAMGEAKDMRAVADILDKVKDSLVGVYESRAGDVDVDFSAAMDEATYYSGRESVDAGLADAVLPNKAAGNGDAGGGLADRVRRRRAAAASHRRGRQDDGDEREESTSGERSAPRRNRLELATRIAAAASGEME